MTQHNEEQLMVVSPYLAAFNAIKTLKASGQEIELSAHGRAGFGNEFFRVRYGQDNLISKVTFRHDLRKQGHASDAMIQYRAAVEGDVKFPWTSLPADFDLTAIPTLFKINPEECLPESLEVAKSLLTALQAFDRTNAYLRQWTASGKGVGGELVVVMGEGDEFFVLELSLNLYYLTTQQRMLKQLAQMANNPKEQVTE